VDYRCRLLLPRGDAVLGLYEHPKRPDLSSGQREFPHFPKPVPPVAVYPGGTRFAIASGDTITVATLVVA
jgi:hypothetical protein